MSINSIFDWYENKGSTQFKPKEVGPAGAKGTPSEPLGDEINIQKSLI